MTPTRITGADEVCDDIDNDDDEVDEARSMPPPTTWMGRRWIRKRCRPLRACEAPAGYAAQDGDCDDSRWSVRPDAEEVCDLLDNDCDGSTDEDPVDGDTFYADLDRDSFGTARPR